MIQLERKLRETSNIDIPGFSVCYVEKCSGSLNSEGILVLCKNGCKYKPEIIRYQSHSHNTSHCLFLSLKFKNIYVIGTYRHPKYPLSECIKAMLESVTTLQHKSCIYVGVVNVDGTIDSLENIRLSNCLKTFWKR